MVIRRPDTIAPRAWRQAAGRTLAEVAAAAGISGKNPSRTLARYETGENVPSPIVVEAVRELSGGGVTAEAWHRVRLDFLEARERAARSARRRRARAG